MRLISCQEHGLLTITPTELRLKYLITIKYNNIKLKDIIMVRFMHKTYKHKKNF